VRWEWLAVACLTYGIGTLPGGLYWHHVLVSLGQCPLLGQSLRAFFFSQLGKYVPGKAMVVVMRTMMVSGPAVRTSIAVTSVFIETLTWMAVGATIGSVMVMVLNPQHRWLVIVGVAVALCAVVAMSPPILGWILRRIAAIAGTQRGSSAIGELRASTIARGWLSMTIGWALVAASLWAVLKAVPGVEPTAEHYWVSLECVTLSIVIGFASLIPGGLGVRELVIVPLLSQDFGAPKALACAVLIRLIWLIAELGIVGIMQAYGRVRARQVGG
jgi:uncharacterized membrane protein YbhN (UPF0104 family)